MKCRTCGEPKAPLYTHPPAQASGAVTGDAAKDAWIRAGGTAMGYAAHKMDLAQGGGNER